MDMVLLAVTLLSLAMAVTLSVIVTRLLREERARSEARVAALTAMAAPPPVADAPGGPAIADLDLFRAGTSAGSAPEAVTGVPHLFEEAEAPSPWGRRFAVIGVLASVVLVGFVLASARSGARASSVPPASTQQAAVLDSAPLELVTLHHQQQADRLVISGLVQNPRSGHPIAHVIATAFLFGPDGAFVTSSRAPLDFTTLSPGDESAFVINAAVTGQIARYRIGFRTEDGRVIEHVDKRAPDALAQK